MKMWGVFRTSLREQLRSPWDLILVLVLAPAFIAMYWSFMGGSSTSYGVLVLDHDVGVPPTGSATETCAVQAVEWMRGITYENGDPILRVSAVDSRAEAERKLRDRQATALIIFPADFTQALLSAQQTGEASTAQVTFVGDLQNPYYPVAAVMASAALEDYMREVMGQPRPVQIVEEPLGGSAVRTEFESYVPGLLIAAGTMMMFSVAIAVTRQIESGTVRRLQLTRMTALDFMGGIGILYTLIALVSVLLSFLTAHALGFRSLGPLWLAILINVLVSLAVIGVGLLTACFSGTVARAAVIVNFPLLLLLFFSGAVFPIKDVELLTIGEHALGAFDLLPHTHAVLALNKVCSLGAGPGDVAFELVALTVLSVAYLAAGVWLFKRMHLSAK